MGPRAFISYVVVPMLLILAAIGIGSFGTKLFRGNALAQVGGGSVPPEHPIQLSYRDLTGVSRQNALVSGGVPLPRDANVTSTANLRLLQNVDGAYYPRPAQFRVLSRWFGTKNTAAKPIKWVLVTFTADIGPNQTRSDYYLDYTAAPVAAPAPDPPVAVVESAAAVTVDTGAAVYTISKTNFNIFDSVQVRDAGGALLNIITPETAAGNEIFAIDKDLSTHTSRHPVTITVEESGPVQATLKIVGGLRPTGASTNFLTQTIRMHFTAGRPDVRIVHVLENNGGYTPFAGSKYLKQVSFKIATDLASPKQLATEQLGSFTGAPFTTESYELTVTGDPAADDPVNPGCFSPWSGCDPTKENQLDNVRLKLTKNQSITLFASGGNGQPNNLQTFSNGYLDVSEQSGARGVAVSRKHFWQTYPNATRVSGNTLFVDLFPPSGPNPGDGHGPLRYLDTGGSLTCPAPNGCDPNAVSFYNLNSGKWMKNEILFHPHAGSAASAITRDASRALQQPLVAHAADPSYYRATGVEDPFFVESLNWSAIPGLTPNDIAALARFDRYARLTWDESVVDVNPGDTLPYNKQTKINTLKRGGGYGGAYHATYGKWLYGNGVWNNFPANNNNHYDVTESFIASGRRFPDFPNFIDAATPLIENTAYPCTIHYSSPNDPSAGGQYYERNAACGSNSDIGPRTSHNYLVGLVKYYEHTGDEFVRAAILQNARFMGGYPAVAAATAPATELNFGIWRNWGRDLENLLAVYLLEGDENYLIYPFSILQVVDAWLNACALQYGSDVDGFEPQSISAAQCYNNQLNNTSDVLFMKAYLAKGLAELHYWDTMRLNGAENQLLRNTFLRLVQFFLTYGKAPGTGSTDPNFPNTTVPYFPQRAKSHICPLRQQPFNNDQVPCSFNLAFPIAGSGNPVPQSGYPGYPSSPITQLYWTGGAIPLTQDWVYGLGYAYRLTGNPAYRDFMDQSWRANMFYLQLPNGVQVTPGANGVDPTNQSRINYRLESYGEWDKFGALNAQSEMWPGAYFLAAPYLGGVTPPPLPTVGVTAPDPNAAEPNDPGLFTVSRTGSAASALTVSVAVSGTATNGGDYALIPGTVVIPADASSVPIPVTVIDDSQVEPTETVILTLVPAAPYTIGNPSSATVSIADNDTLPTAPPQAPSNLAAQAIGPGQINLAWTDNAGDETEYQLERAAGYSGALLIQSLPGTFELIATLPPNSVTYADLGLTPLTTYGYRVRAKNDVGFSEYSATASAITPSGFVPLAVPAAPSNFTAAAASPTTVNLAWTDNAANETGFRIERLVANTLAQIITVPANTTSFTNTGLSPVTAYTYRIRAFNGNGYSAYANTVQVTTPPVASPPPPPPPPPPPSGGGGGGAGYIEPIAAPSNLRATIINPIHVSLAWDDNSYNETNFKIDRSTSAATTGFAQIAIVPSNQTTYGDSNEPDRTYWYRVRASNALGDSPYSNVVEASTVVATGTPAAPTNFGVHAPFPNEPARLRFTWNDPASNEERFELFWGTATAAMRKVNQFPRNNTTFVYPGAGLEIGKTYVYKLRACNAAGCSAFSNTVTITIGTTPRYAFMKNFRLGNEHPDVKILQRCLNANGYEVAKSGPGSRGNETAYLGARTKAAIVRLQETNANAILKPVGLVKGTGYFGPGTRSWVNANWNCQP